MVGCWLFEHYTEHCDYLFQDVFPTDFGPEYDSALQVLMLDFLSRLEKLLPVPDIQQVLKPVWETKHFVVFQLLCVSPHRGPEVGW